MAKVVSAWWRDSFGSAWTVMQRWSFSIVYTGLQKRNRSGRKWISGREIARNFPAKANASGYVNSIWLLNINTKNRVSGFSRQHRTYVKNPMASIRKNTTAWTTISLRRKPEQRMKPCMDCLLKEKTDGMCAK